MSGCLKRTLMFVGMLALVACACIVGATMWGAADLTENPLPTDVPGPLEIGDTVRIARATGADEVPIGDEHRIYLWWSTDREQATCSLRVGAQVELKQHAYVEGAHWYQGANETVDCGGWIAAENLE